MATLHFILYFSTLVYSIVLIKQFPVLCFQRPGCVSTERLIIICCFARPLAQVGIFMLYQPILLSYKLLELLFVNYTYYLSLWGIIWFFNESLAIADSVAVSFAFFGVFNAAFRRTRTE